MNASYQPTRRSIRLAAALAAAVTVVGLFNAVASLGDTRQAVIDAQVRNQPVHVAAVDSAPAIAAATAAR